MERLSFSALVRVEAIADDGLRIAAPWAAMTLPRPTAGRRAVLDILAGQGADELSLRATMVAVDGDVNLLQFGAFLARCDANGLLDRCVSDPSGPLLRFTPRGPLPRPATAPSGRLQLSRFAYLRQDAGTMVLASPRLAGQVRLEAMPMASALAFFASPREKDDLPPGLDTSVAIVVQRLLTALGLLVAEGSEDGPDADPALRQWEFHDLLFHAASRVQSGRPAGGTFRFSGRIEPAPFQKPPMSPDVVPLERPDLEVAVASDPPLVSVIETRRSLYHQATAPITARQLGDLLYRSARVRTVLQTSSGELGSKPYPSGGAIYELEIYLAVDRCDGLTSGFYHYDGFHHQLERLRHRDALVEAMLGEVSRVMPNQSLPQIRFLFTARMPRLAWKYEGVAYALALKNVGVLMQTLYLNATALGLAPIAIGGASSTLFSRATGIPEHVEPHIGEFVVGSRGVEPAAQWGDVAFAKPRMMD